MRNRKDILHNGEMIAQDRYSDDQPWHDADLDRMFNLKINAAMKRFVEDQSFFFIATANDKGQCDASFRSTEPGLDGIQQPSVHVPDPNTLIFPDYSGNNLFNSLGNILVNPNIGMIFINFERAVRARINGKAEIVERVKAYSDTWSTAHRYIKVTVEQAYWNCPQRIPILKPEQNKTENGDL